VRSRGGRFTLPRTECRWHRLATDPAAKEEAAAFRISIEDPFETHDAQVSTRRHDIAATLSERGMARLVSEWASAAAALAKAESAPDTSACDRLLTEWLGYAPPPPSPPEAKPAAARPVAAKLAAAKPAVTKPVAVKPTAKLAATKLAAAKPAVARPASARPAAAKLAAGKPAAAQPLLVQLCAAAVGPPPPVAAAAAAVPAAAVPAAATPLIVPSPHTAGRRIFARAAPEEEGGDKDAPPGHALTSLAREPVLRRLGRAAAAPARGGRGRGGAAGRGAPATEAPAGKMPVPAQGTPGRVYGGAARGKGKGAAKGAAAGGKGGGRKGGA